MMPPPPPPPPFMHFRKLYCTQLIAALRTQKLDDNFIRFNYWWNASCQIYSLLWVIFGKLDSLWHNIAINLHLHIIRHIKAFFFVRNFIPVLNLSDALFGLHYYFFHGINEERMKIALLFFWSKTNAKRNYAGKQWMKSVFTSSQSMPLELTNKSGFV